MTAPWKDHMEGRVGSRRQVEGGGCRRGRELQPRTFQAFGATWLLTSVIVPASPPSLNLQMEGPAGQVTASAFAARLSGAPARVPR